MRTLRLIGFVVFFVAASTAQDAKKSTALEAIKLLPNDDAKLVALIEAREGKPSPERWHILVHDAKAENGLHEYVVAGGEVVASRSLSQFADGLKPDDVIGAEAIKLDSDRAASVVQQYARANKITVGELNYQLVRGDAGAPPVWKVTCVSDTGKPSGSVVLSAADGAVLSHEGFPKAPAAKDKPSTKPARDIRATASRKRSDQTRVASVSKPVPMPPPEEVAEQPRPRSRGLFERAGGSLQKIFTGRNAPSR